MEYTMQRGLAFSELKSHTVGATNTPRHACMKSSYHNGKKTTDV